MSTKKRTVENGVNLRVRWKTQPVCDGTNTFFDLEGFEKMFGKLGVVTACDGSLSAGT